MRVILRPTTINGGGRSIELVVAMDDGLWWENVCCAEAADMTVFYTPRLVLGGQS
jgi:hypothetical protein